MSEQLSLFEIPRRNSPKYSLFLALFPDPRTARNIINLGNAIRRERGMRGRLRPVSHLHVSLCGFDGDADVREAVVEFIDSICKAVVPSMSPFEICFNQVLSFQNRAGNHPLVLHRDNHDDGAIIRLHGLLHAELAKYAFSNRPHQKFNPHVTLLYDERQLPVKPIEPVCWTVKEIVLVCSEIGATKYQYLRRWALGPSIR
jgi:2'-5' RNA ligase